MNFYALLKLVPDTVEELEIADDGKSLDEDALRFKLDDADEHVVEQGLLLKEQHGGTLTAVAIESPEVDDALFTALAKGADKVVKLTGDFPGLGSTAGGDILHAYLTSDGAALSDDTLILIRSQAIDELEGEVGVYLAAALGLPYVGVVAGVAVADGTLTATKEFAGGLRGKFEVGLPAVLGIQSAEKPPRYVPFAKVRNAMKEGQIEEVPAATPAAAAAEIEKLYTPEPTGHAEMLKGDADSVAGQIVEVLAKNSLL